jgi:hypothetical protein
MAVWSNEEVIAAGKVLIERFGSYEMNNSIDLQCEVTALREALEETQAMPLGCADELMRRRHKDLLIRIPK